jgi:gluconolactonase
MQWSPRILATGLSFPEGPVTLGRDDVVFVEIQAQQLSRYAGGSVTRVAHTGGGPNGAARGPDGAFYLANNGGLSMGPGGYWRPPVDAGGRIQRVALDGSVSDVVASLAPPPARPNDLCFGPDGALYFTDPRNWEDFEHLEPGRVWRTDLSGNTEILAEGLAFPNGLAFAPGGQTLYVAQSTAMTILAFPWTPEGLGEPRVHCKLERGFPDGMCVSSDGRLFACGSMGHVIEIFDPDGAAVEVVEAPKGSEPTNCCLGAEGTLYVTLSGSGSLVAFDDVAEPLPLH